MTSKNYVTVTRGTTLKGKREINCTKYKIKQKIGMGIIHISMSNDCSAYQIDYE